MKKSVIILTALGLVLASAAATPFVVSQWITVIERNHAYQRELETEARQERAAIAQAIENTLNAEADEFDNDAEEFRKHYPQMTEENFDLIYDRAKERDKARNQGHPIPYNFFDTLHPNYALLYGSSSNRK
jgi:hypothetical protein